MTGADLIKCQFVKDINKEYDVDYCNLQEHFKTTKNLDSYFRKNFSEYHCYCIPAFRAPGVDCGRGKGGIIQLSSKKSGQKRSRIIFKSKRLMGQIITFSKCKILWINTYLPCDPQSQGGYDDSELLETLSEVINAVTANPGMEILWAGDFNYEITRDNQFTRAMASCLQQLGLVSIWQQNNIDFTHIHTDGISKSTIDHFMVTPALVPLIKDSGPVHRGDNLSRHSPIFVTLNLSNIQSQTSSCQPPPQRNPAWDKASSEELDNYTTTLHTKLQGIKVPDSIKNCKDSFCKIECHTEDCDSLVLDILLSIVETSYTTLPLTGTINRNNVTHKHLPGWNKEVSDLQQKSRYAYRVWLANGKPNQGPIHSEKLRSQSVFRQAVRKIKRNSKKYQAEALLEAALQGDLNLMKEMKRIKSGKGALEELPSCVDGAEGEQEIANKFKEVYELLYNSADSETEMMKVKDILHGMIKAEDPEPEIRKITGEIVKEAITRMKPHKMDVSQGYTSDSLLHAPDLLFYQLSLVFQDWLRHGRIQSAILSCAFIPLIKSSLKDPECTDSYRAIAGSSLFLKTFELCILTIWGDKLNSDNLQFGFKKKCSTSSATWLVQETLQHFLRNGSKPIAVVLDCSKAFDKAQFSTLFTSLLQRGVPAIVVRVLCFSYQERLAWIRWGRRTTSDSFKIKNGTRQGSVASPSFWCVYLDPLFSRLRKAGWGCTVAGVWCGVVGYADDLILLAPSRHAAQKMLIECSDFAQQNNIMFSTDPDPSKSKSKALYVVGPRGSKIPKPTPLKLGDMELPWVERCEHLGHTLHSDGSMRQDCLEKRAQFIQSSVKIRETFSFAYPEQQLNAIEKYCCSWYGSNLWDLNGDEAKMVYASWRTNCKLTWDVPRGTRTYLLQQTLTPELIPLRVRMLLKFQGFFKSLLNSPSQEVQLVARLAGRDIRSNAGSNLALLRSETGLDPWEVSNSQLKAALLRESRVETPPMDFWRPSYLAKLLKQRMEAYYKADEGECLEVQKLIDSLCIN